MNTDFYDMHDMYKKFLSSKVFFLLPHIHIFLMYGDARVCTLLSLFGHPNRPGMATSAQPMIDGETCLKKNTLFLCILFGESCNAENKHFTFNDCL